jgi:hypothetical protein
VNICDFDVSAIGVRSRGEIAGFPAGLKKYRIGMKIAP